LYLLSGFRLLRGALGTAGVLFPAAKLPLAGFWLLIMGEDPDLDLQHPAVFHLGDSDRPG